MLTRKTTWGVVAVLVIVGLLLVGQSLSQPGQREASLQSHPLAASSFARTLTDMNYSWQINVKTLES